MVAAAVEVAGGVTAVSKLCDVARQVIRHMTGLSNSRRGSACPDWFRIRQFRLLLFARRNLALAQHRPKAERGIAEDPSLLRGG
jgi:hypothetical protein